MRKIAVLLAGLIFSVSAHAEFVTFEYTGIINTLREFSGSHQKAVASSTIVPGSVRVGDSYHGSFTLDTSMKRYAGSTDGNAFYFDWSSVSPRPIDFIMDKTGTSISGSASPNVYVTNGTTDSVYISGATTLMSGFTLSFVDLAGTALSNLDIPLAYNLDAWYSAEASMWWNTADASKQVMMYGMLTSITRVSPVPEPTSYALFFAGIALVSGAVARKRKQAV